MRRVKSSMAFYSFANCLLYHPPFTRRPAERRRSVMNMRTEGIVRLLSGEGFQLCAEHKERLYGSAPWAAYVERLGIQRHPRLREFDVFYPLRLEWDDLFFWSPFADCLSSLTEARCSDQTPYPYLDEPIHQVFAHEQRTTLEQCESPWHAMIEKLTHVHRKGLVLYPADHLGPPEVEAQHAAELRAHIDSYNNRARTIFGRAGWSVFMPSALRHRIDPYWAHYDPAALRELWKDIKETFHLPSTPLHQSMNSIVPTIARSGSSSLPRPSPPEQYAIL